MKQNLSIVLVGFGPHSRRTYVNFFKKYNIFPKLVIDLESNHEFVTKYMKSFAPDAELLFLDDIFRDDDFLPESLVIRLDEICNRLQIDHALIVSEPKSHFMYIQYFLERNINVLTEKPITAPKQLRTVTDAETVKNNYDKLMEIQKRSSAKLFVMCQRSYHQGYREILKTAQELITDYHVPITSIHIDSCDGNWVFPHDMFYENHPYKYGYGKLYHSGYHFIDLLSKFIKLNKFVNEKKLPHNLHLSTVVQNFNDMNSIINHCDYRELFKGHLIPKAYYGQEYEFGSMGEMNVNTLMYLTNKADNIITNISLNIHQLGFSRRGWMKTHPDHYKGNGRVRQESVNIQIGPLMAIRVNSYQSKESKDRTENEYEVGGLDHFDIDIFRNVDIIGGQAHTRLTSKDLLKNNNLNLIGLNEEARDLCLQDFFSEPSSEIGNAKDHALGVEMLSAISKSVLNFKVGEFSTESFSLVNML